MNTTEPTPQPPCAKSGQRATVRDTDRVDASVLAAFYAADDPRRPHITARST